MSQLMLVCIIGIVYCKRQNNPVNIWVNTMDLVHGCFHGHKINRGAHISFTKQVRQHWVLHVSIIMLNHHVSINNDILVRSSMIFPILQCKIFNILISVHQSWIQTLSQTVQFQLFRYTEGEKHTHQLELIQ